MICKGRYVCEVDEYFWLSICNAVLILMDTSMFRFTMRTFLLFSFNTFALFFAFHPLSTSSATINTLLSNLNIFIKYFMSNITEYIQYPQNYKITNNCNFLSSLIVFTGIYTVKSTIVADISHTFSTFPSACV